MGIYLNRVLRRNSFIPISRVFQVYIGKLIQQVPNLVCKPILIYYLILLSFITIEVHVVALPIIKYLVCTHQIGQFDPFPFYP